MFIFFYFYLNDKKEKPNRNRLLKEVLMRKRGSWKLKINKFFSFFCDLIYTLSFYIHLSEIESIVPLSFRIYIEHNSTTNVYVTNFVKKGYSHWLRSKDYFKSGWCTRISYLSLFKNVENLDQKIHKPTLPFLIEKGKD